MALPRLRNNSESLLIIADNRIENKQEIIGGLICCAILEAYVIQLSIEFNVSMSGVNGNKEYIIKLYENNKINNYERDKLFSINNLRNDIIHFNEARIMQSNDIINARVIDNSKEIKSQFIKLLYPGWKKPDYELLADKEAGLFPNWWSIINEKNKPPVPPEIKTEFFANLKTAQEKYMIPLGEYLQTECLKTLHPELRFADLSRINSTSGYVWMSAVSTRKRRARVRHPGLTVLFMPHEVAVYLELPGKSHDYKKEYYGNLLFDEKFLDYISSEDVKKRSFEFFHTWWYAMREQACSVEHYVASVRGKDGQWECLLSRTREIFDKLAEEQPIFTQNFFLIGKGYPRKDILSDEHLRTRLHEEIIQDFKALFPIYEMLQDKVSSQTVLG